VSRLLSNFGNGLGRTAQGIYARLFAGYTTSPAARDVGGGGASGRESRLSKEAYRVRDLMLDGTVYAPRRGTAGGGYLWDIQRALGKPCDADAPPILPYYNPVPAVVGCYQNAVGGRLGEELKVEDPNGDPLKRAVEDAIRRVWRWSNLDASLEELTTLVANQGTAGIRVVSEGGPDPRVYLRFDHPGAIADAEEDARGNLVNVLLRYQTYFQENLGDPYTPVEVEELIGKQRHSQLIGGVQQLEADQQRNALGVCPYVVIRHARRTGEFFGRHAYDGSEMPIHGINWGLSQVDEATARAINETVFMAGAGDAPDEMQLGRLTAMYVKLSNGVPAPEMKYIVPQLAIGETGESIVRNVELLYTRQPELILNALKLLSGTSGETLAQVLKPVEAAVLRARRMYESAIVSAVQIALSAGVLLGLWDLGTGTGTADAADRAYDGGQGPEAFRFADRPALPPTPQQMLTTAQASVADKQAKATLAKSAVAVSDRERLRLAGYTDAEIEQIESEKADQDVLDSEDSAAADETLQ
jgi:hypothetical protein